MLRRATAFSYAIGSRAALKPSTCALQRLARLASASNSVSADQSPIKGSATADATRQYCERFTELPHAQFPKTGLSVSQIGFGGFRIRPETEHHKEALLAALRSGVNIIDTSAHFGNGMSEILIGDAIREATASGILAREDLVVVTKAGFVVGKPTKPFPGHIQVSDQLGHCISPEFLEAEITGSLDRLGLETIDVFLLNNPERLMHSKDSKSASKQQVYDSIVTACSALDKEVARGRIGSYGIASNSMHISTVPDALELPHLIHHLKDASLLNNFSTIQAPFNMMEIDLMMPRVDGSPSLLQICMDHNLFLMAQRPLYAISQGKIRLLATSENEPEDAESKATTELHDMFHKFAAVEPELNDIFKTKSLDREMISKFSWCHIFAEYLSQLTENPYATEHYFSREVIPKLNNDLRELAKFSGDASEDEKSHIASWSQSYSICVRNLSDQILELARLRALQANAELNGTICALSRGNLSANDSLSVNALRIALSTFHRATPNPTSTVLVGMREPNYVTAAINAASRKFMSEDALESIYESGLLRDNIPDGSP